VALLVLSIAPIIVGGLVCLAIIRRGREELFK
jgi:hypothetical protein